MARTDWVPDEDRRLVLDEANFVLLHVVIPCQKTGPDDFESCSVVNDDGRHTHDTILTGDQPTADDCVVGLSWWHQAPDGSGWCVSGLGFANVTRPDGREVQSNGHTLEAIDPLHVEASLLCPTRFDGCGAHGFIRGGTWVPA